MDHNEMKAVRYKKYLFTSAAGKSSALVDSRAAVKT